MISNKSLTILYLEFINCAIKITKLNILFLSKYSYLLTLEDVQMELSQLLKKLSKYKLTTISEAFHYSIEDTDIKSNVELQSVCKGGSFLFCFMMFCFLSFKHYD